MSGDDHGTLDFEETYSAHRMALVRLAFLMCGSRDLSEDLVQTVFASAHPRWHTIENHLAYLKRGVVNLAKDGQRRDVSPTMLRSSPGAGTCHLHSGGRRNLDADPESALGETRRRRPPLLRGSPTC